MNKQGTRKKPKMKRRGNKPPQNSKSDEAIVIDYLTKMMDNLGVNSVKNANEVVPYLWENMLSTEACIIENAKQVAKEKKLSTEKSYAAQNNSNRFNSSYNNHNNNNYNNNYNSNGYNGRKNGKNQRQNSRNDGYIAADQPHTELMKLGVAETIIELVVPGSITLYHGKIPYFRNELTRIPFKSFRKLYDNIFGYLTQTADNLKDYISAVNWGDIETLRYIQYRRNFPNSPIDETMDNTHPLHNNPLLFKLITSKNVEIPPRVEIQIENWRYVEQTIFTISRQNAILFAIDIEGFESNQNIITEIGISIYDPRENLPEDGVTVPILRNYHIVVSEFFTLRNKNYLTDVKDCYLLGESIILPYDQCAHFIQSLINYYMFPQTPAEKTWGRCFVGHGMSNDLTWLKSMGIKFPPIMKDISTRHLPNEADDTAYIIDTGKFHQIMYGDTYGSLGKNLKLHNIPHSYLHNAGNDAYYTLQLLFNIGNIKFRETHHLDDYKFMAHRIRKYQLEDDRAMGKNIDPESLQLPGGSYIYNIPMTDIAAVIEFIKMNNQPARTSFSKKNGSNRREGDIRKRRENLLGISQFRGMRWEDSVEKAFLAVDDFPDPD
ncbi:hypothetical protein MOSE0_J09142 [Monosporozyma servazzii]